MSFGFLGIEFGWGLQLAHMTAIDKYLGADERSIPFLWLAGPIAGLLVNPRVGVDERSSNRTGQRRPCFLGGALASAALFVMPRCAPAGVCAGRAVLTRPALLTAAPAPLGVLGWRWARPLCPDALAGGVVNVAPRALHSVEQVVAVVQLRP